MDFNEEIYKKTITRVKLFEEIKALIDNAKDDLLVVLRIHLMCENLLEAWICASIGESDFFVHPKELRLTFSNKLGIAYNLKLPKPAYDFFKKINQVRNKFSHKIEHRDITVGLASELESTITKLVPHNAPKITISEDNKEIYSIDDPSTPERVKLCLLFIVFQLNLTLATMPDIGPDETGETKTATFTFSM